MLEQQEKLWDYKAVAPGQTGSPTVVHLKDDHITRYARVAQCRDARYQQGDGQEYEGALVAMPTMVLTYAPLLRDDIAEANGFVALEEAKTAPRQTPFAKCEIRWRHPVQAGDTITGSRSVLEKYERRGSKFVTFHVEAVNQLGRLVAEYDYTCIFEYAQGQKKAPEDQGTAKAALPGQDAPGPGTRAAQLLRYDEISVGEPLASLAISESQEVISSKNDFRLAGRVRAVNIHTDEEFARQNIFGGRVNAGPSTMSYVDQMLQLSFPLRAFYEGGSLLMRAIEPFRAGDTVVFQGEVTAKRQEEGKSIVECRVKGLNQRGGLVSLSDATLVMPG